MPKTRLAGWLAGWSSGCLAGWLGGTPRGSSQTPNSCKIYPNRAIVFLFTKRGWIAIESVVTGYSLDRNVIGYSRRHIQLKYCGVR